MIAVRFEVTGLQLAPNGPTALLAICPLSGAKQTQSAQREDFSF